MKHRGGGVLDVWQDSNRQLGDDDIMMDSWLSQRHASNMTGVEGLYNPTYPSYAAQPWPSGTAVPVSRTGANVNNTRHRKDSNSQHFMMTLRDDQFGQTLEEISPSKKQRSKPNGLPSQPPRTHHSSNQIHRPPKMGALSVPVRPASAAMARSAAYSESHAKSRDCMKRPLSGQAESSANTLFSTNSQHIRNKEPRDTIVPIQNPFVREPQRWDSDVSMRDGSSNFSSLSRFERDPASPGSKVVSAHAPAASVAIKSRKEGLSADASDALDTDTRYDHSLLPTLDFNLTRRNADNTKMSVHNGVPGADANVEVVDVDAIDPSLVTETTADLAKLSPFKPAHKAGMSSISSTGRLERQLYSALGEELGSFEQRTNTAETGSELAEALPNMSAHKLARNASGEPDLVAKRKRQGTLGGERDPSPTKKKEKAQQAGIEDADIQGNMPQLGAD